MATVRDYRSDDVKMNLTPMIDMTFLLVVFFMITIDMTVKDLVPVALPVASKGAEPDKTEVPWPKLTINLLENGNIHWRGRVYVLDPLRPDETRASLDTLRSDLDKITNERGNEWRETDGTSKIPVLIHGDREARWEYVQWIMMVLADQRVQIYQIRFSVKQPVDEQPQN